MPGTTPPLPRGPWPALLARLPAPGWRRALLVRRIVAGLLVAAALVLALSPVPGSTGRPVLVAAHDLTAGTTLGPADLAVRSWPDALVPTGVLHRVADAEGRVLAGAARAGEPVTDLRLAGQALAVHAAGVADAVSVPIRLADPAVAALLATGSVVDVVTAGSTAGEAVVLARGAVVVTVLAAEPGVAAGAGRGRVVLVALPQQAATRLAAAALSEQVAVTLR